MKRNRIYISIKDTIFRRLRMALSRKDIIHTFDIEIGSLYQQSGDPIIIVPKDGSLKEPTPGTTGLRKLLVKYGKKLENYFALVCLGCCILVCRRIILG
jgi:hypothetical protein